ncbi:MAG: TetR/AcrR family transcriptional regulator [Acidimicrobiales bacterium]
MPKQVDHDERRREIIEALWALAAREGLSAVSFRRVAAKADVSVRRIQYYFGTKASLLAAALEMLGQAVFARGVAAMDTAGPGASPRSMLHLIIEAGLPSTRDQRQDSLLFFSFYVAALTDPELASTEAQQILGWTIPFAANLIRTAEASGQAKPGIDPDHEARILMSAFYGLSLSVLAGTQTPQDALAAIDYHLDRIFV